MIQTKRFLYNILKGTVCNTTGCYAVKGARGVGKTTLFLQLKEYFGDKAEYINCANLPEDGSFDFGLLYRNAIDKGVKIMLFDEICKVGIDYYADFKWGAYKYAYETKDLCILISFSMNILYETMNPQSILWELI